MGDLSVRAKLRMMARGFAVQGDVCKAGYMERLAIQLEEESKPTIADYLQANKEMIDKTGCKVVTIASLKKFGGLE